MQPTVVFVPGLRDYVADHWQTLLEPRYAKTACVPRLGKDNLSCAAWVDALDRTVAAVEGPIVLAAHSAGVMMVAHWARRLRRPVQGALLAAPPDFEFPLPAGYPGMDRLRDGGWIPTPRGTLPFASIVVASSNDPLATLASTTRLASDWGSRLVNAGAVGHLNPASGFGHWPQAAEFLCDLGVPYPAAAEAATR